MFQEINYEARNQTDVEIQGNGDSKCRQFFQKFDCENKNGLWLEKDTGSGRIMMERLNNP